MPKIPRSAQHQGRTLRTTVLVCFGTLVIHLLLLQRSTLSRVHSQSYDRARVVDDLLQLEETVNSISELTGGDTKLEALVKDMKGHVEDMQQTLMVTSRVFRIQRERSEEEKAEILIKRLNAGVNLGLDPNRKKIRMFVGVFTGFNDPGRKENPADKDRYNYRKRRKALRDTWFPSTREERQRLEKEKGIVVRFILGHTNDQNEELVVAQESQENEDFLRIPVKESYYSLTNKTKNFFTTVSALYDADWVVKVDDDIYLTVERILLAIKQWEKMGAGYIGCMKHGSVWKEENTRWYEPQHLLVGNQYYLHAYGSIYAMPKKTIEDVIIRNYNNLRFFANEDTTVGSWMLGHNVTHFEDMRLCATKCSNISIGILKNECAGLCNPLRDLPRLHSSLDCKGKAEEPLGYMPSYPEHTAFESMRV